MSDDTQAAERATPGVGDAQVHAAIGWLLDAIKWSGSNKNIAPQLAAVLGVSPDDRGTAYRVIQHAIQDLPEWPRVFEVDTDRAASQIGDALLAAGLLAVDGLHVLPAPVRLDGSSGLLAPDYTHDGERGWDTAVGLVVASRPGVAPAFRFAVVPISRDELLHVRAAIDAALAATKDAA